MKILKSFFAMSFACCLFLTSNALDAKPKHHNEELQSSHKHHAFIDSKNFHFILGGNKSLGISGNKDFTFDLNDLFEENELAILSTKYIQFNQDFDCGNGVYFGAGYMLNQNMAIGAEIGFNKLKNKNHNPKHHDEFHNHGEITSDIFHGMINFTQYFDSINSAIKPYASIGAGFARISAEGNLDFEIKNLIRNDSKKISISFSELEKFTFAYQFGLGFETISSKNVNFGVGYKYFATHGIETHDEDLKLNAQINSQQANQVNRIDFGSLKHQNHMLNLFVKFKI